MDLQDVKGIASHARPGLFGLLTRNHWPSRTSKLTQDAEEVSTHNEVRCYYANLMTRVERRGVENWESRKEHVCAGGVANLAKLNDSWHNTTTTNAFA